MHTHPVTGVFCIYKHIILSVFCTGVNQAKEKLSNLVENSTEIKTISKEIERLCTAISKHEQQALSFSNNDTSNTIDLEAGLKTMEQINKEIQREEQQ